MSNSKKPMGPPPFPGEEAMISAHEKFVKWVNSEEGKAFLKEHISEETYEQLQKDLAYKPDTGEE